MDRLNKSSHFLSVNVSYSEEDYDRLYIKKIVRFHGAPFSIILNRGAQFNSNFWRYLQSCFATQVKLSITFLPQTDGQEKHTIQFLDYMFRECVIDFRDNWNDHLLLIEFFNNNSYHLSISRAPFESLYGKRCQSHVCWFEAGEFALVGLDVVYEATGQF